MFWVPLRVSARVPLTVLFDLLGRVRNVEFGLTFRVHSKYCSWD